MIGWILGILGISAGDGNIVGWLDVALSGVGLFAILATRTPNKVDDKVAQLLMDFVNFLGANLGKAKNAILILAMASFVMLGTGCETLRPMWETSCGMMGIGVRVGPSTASFDLCDIPGTGADTPEI